MSPDAKVKLRQLLVQHEGLRTDLYTDSTGHISIGVGRCLSTRGISQVEAFYLLDDDIQYFHGKLSHYLPFFSSLDENRQIALCDMAFNIGIQGIINFHDMILALEGKDYQRAAQAMLDSKWHEQTGERATRLANIIRTGEI